jgi:hypothetical protein
MNFERLKKFAYLSAIALILLLSSGLASEVQAQGRWDRWENRRERREEWRERQRERIRERARARLLLRQQQRRAYQYRNFGNRGSYESGGYDRNDGYYGNSGRFGGSYGYSNSEFQRGFSDGLRRGRDDARDRDPFNPNTGHFRSGSAAYRGGFQQGYSQGYRQFAGSRRW